MIVLRNLTKTFSLNGRRKVVANNINATFPSGVSVGLLGRNGAGKSTLLKIIAGTTHATSGEVLSSGSISFPVGLASALHPDMTGAQNTRFVARIYGADTEALMAYVEEFAELGEHFHLPVRSYSSGMRGRLSFGINMGLKFDTYLIDEVTATGDASFKKKSRDVFLHRMRDAGAVFVSHSMGTIRELCSAGAFLDNGKLTYFEEVEEAIERYMFSLDATMSHLGQAPDDGLAQMRFPRDARMLFGVGLPHTRQDWLGDCLRRHRPCHFGKNREPHYFDVRAGILEVIKDRRLKTPQQLSNRLRHETPQQQRNTLRLLSEVSELITIHAAPQTGPDRHDAYLSYIQTGRKTQPVICDFTPSYSLLGAEDFSEMATVGWARFVCVLRDPAARLWAQIWERIPQAERSAEAATDLACALVQQPERLQDYPEADYARLFQALDTAVPQDRVIWLFHEALTGRSALRPLCDILDIPNVPEISLPPLPVEEEPVLPVALRDELRKLLAPQYRAARRKFADQLPADWD